QGVLVDDVDEGLEQSRVARHEDRGDGDDRVGAGEVSSAVRSSPVGKPVSMALVMSWARSRSSMVTTSAAIPRSVSASVVAWASRSASILVEEGWLRPAETTAMVRVVM